MTKDNGDEIPNGFVWVFFLGSWTMCYKNQYGIDAMNDWGMVCDDDLQGALFGPVTKPQDP